MRMVMEKSLNMKNWQKIMEVYALFSDNKKLSIGLESLHFPTFSANVANADFKQRDGHRKLKDSHGQFTEKKFGKSLGTLTLLNNRNNHL